MLTVADLLNPAARWDGHIWSCGHHWSGRQPSTYRFVDGYSARPHTGIDLAAPSGSPLVAPADGVVTVSGFSNDSAGYVVAVRHRLLWRDEPEDIWSRHCHCLRSGLAPKGSYVEAGAQIALCGSTGESGGPHDHYSLIIGKEWADWRTEPERFIDPEPIVDPGGALLMSPGYPYPEDVKRLQRRLNTVGYTPPLKIDGDYGKATGVAVKWFQTKAGLHPSGEANPITLAVLFARKVIAP